MSRLFYDEAMSNAASPPDGLVVLDFSPTFAGPYCKIFMATSGAKVVEIEEPEHGERPRTGSVVSGLRFGLFCRFEPGHRSEDARRGAGAGAGAVR